MITLLAVIFVFGLLIIGHEFGHFITAKLSGIKVDEFSFGMGPRILRFGKGETVYSWRVFPIGGFVKMLGEDEQVDDPKSFSTKPTWVRIAVIASGPFMNILISILIFAIIAMTVGYVKPVVKDYVTPENNETNVTYPAESAGILPGDRIIKANDERIYTYSDFQMFMYENGGKSLNLTVKRHGKTEVLKNIVPVLDPTEGRYLIGITPDYGRASFFEGIQYGAFNTLSLGKQIINAFIGLFTGSSSTEDVSGPVGIIKFTGDAAKQGFDTLLVFTAFLSINLAIMNLLPFPALDGGWLLILLIEGIRRKKLDSNKVGIINFIGFAFLMIIMVLVTFRDFIRLNIF